MPIDPRHNTTLSPADNEPGIQPGSALDAAQSAVSNPRGWLDYLLHIAVLAACAMAMSNNLAEPDLWGHVQYGRDAMRSGLSRTATYTYTAEGTPWINHEVLSEYLLAVGVDTIGVSGLLIAKCGLGLLVMSLVLSCGLRKGLSPFAAYFMAILTATNLTFFWVLRPQLFLLARLFRFVVGAVELVFCRLGRELATVVRAMAQNRSRAAGIKLFVAPYAIFVVSAGVDVRLGEYAWSVSRGPLPDHRLT